MSNIEKAVKRFKGGLNCSQAIVATYCSALGLEEDLGVKVAAAFGGGNLYPQILLQPQR